VESEPGKGAKFAFTFRAQLRAPETKDDGPVSLAGKTALLADDMEINREIVMTMLEGSGLQIVCAENGREALEKFSSDPDKYDVILMDINMPEMDGLEATRRIRVIEAERSSASITSQIPIIAITANVLMSEVDLYLAAGMTDHIGKPVDFDKLLSKLHKYLKR